MSKSKIYKSKYRHYGNKNVRKSCLDVGMKGFLCSCNNREKECISEAYNILNKYADLMGIPQQIEDNPKDDIQDNLSNEIAALKSTEKVNKFQVVESGAKNFLFIKTTLEKTVDLASMIVADIVETKNQQTKFLIRLIPIEITCKAYMKDIEAAFRPLGDKYFTQVAKTFAIVYNHRNNNNLNRDEVTKLIADLISQLNPCNKVDLKTPELVVVVEVIKGIVLLSVIPKYFQYKKFNLLALAGENVSSITPNRTEDEINDKDNS